ncbi:SRPBCC family protein [Lignipirellula cremea]|uniref:Coenzyme Q-binding protein COQ10 START domain-containing protein n=1 Tax=Lignipirellula cremea TaxID=2528010 RepID=A0A518DXR3_9BACT|nr:SRPBCC family protein [Lignipirellula cremea]QDU96636.1 hypothetical protein Pla8534_44570 [Lignipirellula cremea]
MGRTHLLERKQTLAAPLEKVFAFFSDASNLEAITPPSLHFQIVTPLPIVMQEGTLIDYRLRLLGVPFSWKTRIDCYEPPVKFVDRQVSGPYDVWRHTHTFAATPEGVEMIDRVEYRLPWSILGDLAHAVYVRRTLEQIFDYRQQTTARLLQETTDRNEWPRLA